MDKLFILEGVDGTGKTSYASEVMKYVSWDNVVNYIYFPKHENVEDTIIYWKTLTRAIKNLKGTVILDRSIISTFVYHFENAKYELLGHLLYTVNPANTVILYFSNVYQKENGIDYDTILRRYKEYLSVVETRYKVIYVDE